MVVSATYMLRAVASTVLGPLHPELEQRAGIADLGWSERLAPLLLLGASLALGFNPSILTRLLAQ